MPAPVTPPHERVLSRVVAGHNGCWVFTGARNHRGYGIVQIGRGKGTDRTHRVTYEAMVAPIPDGMTIDHLCANTSCCNPAHLEVVTRAENARRQAVDGRSMGGRHLAARTHCANGHEFTPENTGMRSGTGTRLCRACARDAYRRRPQHVTDAYNARRREQRAAAREG